MARRNATVAIVGAGDFNPFFPVNTLMRGAVAAHRLGVFAKYVACVFDHLWAEPEKMDEAEVIRAALAGDGLDAAAILALAQDAAVKQALLANTEMSVQRGAFGSPTFFVDEEMYFGKDRLVDVEEAIRAA